MPASRKNQALGLGIAVLVTMLIAALGYGGRILKSDVSQIPPFSPTADVWVPGDYDGDGTQDVAVWHGDTSIWEITRSSSRQRSEQAWGAGYAPYFDLPVPGDYDGDGKTDLAVWRRQNGTWYIIQSSDGTYIGKAWGSAYAPYNDIPLQRDYDGDGKTDIAVKRPGEQRIHIIQSSNGQTTSISSENAGPANGWDYNLTKRCIKSIGQPGDENYYQDTTDCDASGKSWLVVNQSEINPKQSCPGPVGRSFPINAPGSPLKMEWLDHTDEYGRPNRMLHLRTDFSTIAHPCGNGNFTFFSLMDHQATNGGPFPRPDQAAFSARMRYQHHIPRGQSRAMVGYQGWWNGKSHVIEINTYTSPNWGDADPAPDIIINAPYPDFQFINLDGRALGIDMTPGEESTIEIDWSAILENLMQRGLLERPREGNWNNTATQDIYVGTEFKNETAAAGAGSNDLWVTNFRIEDKSVPRIPPPSAQPLTITVSSPTDPQPGPDTDAMAGGTYTLQAKEADRTFTGRLEYKLRKCQPGNPEQCETETTGPWLTTDGQGQVVAPVPDTFPAGIYRARFRPHGRTGVEWSNEITVTVHRTEKLYGVQSGIQWVAYPGSISEKVAHLKRLGLNAARITANWSLMEPTQGRYDWNGMAFDELIREFTEAGIKPVVILYGSPSWANGVAPSLDSWYAAYVPTDPARRARWIEDYAKFTRDLVTRYKNQVRHWELWNEPNLKEFWRPAPNIEAYAQWSAAMERAIKSSDPSAKVAYGSLAIIDGYGQKAPEDIIGIDFLNGLYDRGLKPEVVSIHNYALTDAPPDQHSPGDNISTWRDAETIKGIMDRRGSPNGRIWITEYGWRIGAGAVTSEEIQAQYLRRSLEIMRDSWPYVDMAMWHLDYHPDAFWTTYALIRNDFSIRPAGTALKNFIMEATGSTPTPTPTPLPTILPTPTPTPPPTPAPTPVQCSVLCTSDFHCCAGQECVVSRGKLVGRCQ